MERIVWPASTLLKSMSAWPSWDAMLGQQKHHNTWKRHVCSQPRTVVYHRSLLPDDGAPMAQAHSCRLPQYPLVCNVFTLQCRFLWVSRLHVLFGSDSTWELEMLWLQWLPDDSVLHSSVSICSFISPGVRHGHARSRVCQMDEYSFRLRWYASLPLWTISSVQNDTVAYNSFHRNESGLRKRNTRQHHAP